MSFWNRPINHHFRSIYSKNPLLGENLVFLLDKNLEDSRLALQRDLEALESRLEREMDLIERSKIKDEIKSIEEEMESLSNVSAPLNTSLLNGLQNNIDDIDVSLEKENDIKKRQQLEAKRLGCIDALKTRQKPVTSAGELNDAVDQIESDERLISSLSGENLDQVDIDLLLNSDLASFFDSKFEGDLKVAYEQMLTNDNVQSALGRSRSKLFEEADTKWTNYKNETKAEIRSLEIKRWELRSKLGPASFIEKHKIIRELNKIEHSIVHYKAQIKKGRSDWTHKQRTTDEATTSRSVLDSVKPETLSKLKQLLTEAQAIRMEKVREYLTSQVVSLEDRLAEVKSEGNFSNATIQAFEKELAEARNIIVERGNGDPEIIKKMSDPKVLRKLSENFKAAKASLGASAKEVEAVENNRSAIETDITWNYKKLSAFIDGLSPEKIQELKDELLAKHGKTGFEGISPILKKQLNALDALIDPKSETRQQMTELGAQLKNISDISPEELIAIKNDLDTLVPKLGFLKDTDGNLEEINSDESKDAKLAHKTIKELESAQNAAEIEEILSENIGLERLQNHKDEATEKIQGDPNKHAKVIPSSEFENEYRGYTKKGKMVFYERGDEWYIFIDESALNDSNAAELIKQLTHELLHVEFEKSKQVKTDVRKTLVEDNPEKWSEIRAAFLEMAKDTDKEPPNGEEWSDDDILSELYAMQNEMGRTWSEGKTPTDKLNNLLTGMGAAAAIHDIAEKTRGYKEDAKIRGYEEGAEASEGGGGSDSLHSPLEAQSKEAAVYEKNKNEIEHIRERLEELKKSEYLGMVPDAEELVGAMAGFNDGTERLNRDLLSEADGDILTMAITARNEKVSGDLNAVEDQVGKAARNAPNSEMGLLRKMWISTTFNSVEDFVQVGIDAYEFFQRRHKRRNADHAANLGMALFSGTDLGREATARGQKAESEEVNEWKSRYEHLDAWQLEDELKGIAHGSTPNADQLKAIMRILAEKGRLNLRNEDLWIALNKLQSAVLLKPGDQILLHNPILLRQKLHRALGEIYDYDEFPTLVRSHEGAYQSEKGKYDTENNRTQNVLTDRLDELLSQAREGDQIDPMQYESIIEYCIKNGKSYAENVMFHIIAGMANGLLAPDRGLALGEHLNAWPAVDWFSTLSPPMTTEDWKRYALQNFGSDFNRGSISADGYGNQFKNWYWTVVQNNSQVIERVKKSVGERSWDHDWGRSIACLGDANTAKNFLAGKSGQQETKITGVSNAYVGAVQWLEENAKNPQFANKANFARMAGWIAMAEGVLDGTAYNRKEADISTRSNEAMNQDLPRERGVGNHGDFNTKQHREITQQFLFTIEPNFFGIFAGQEARSDEKKQELGIQARDYLIQRYPSLAQDMAEVETVDQIYNNLDLIISTMFKEMSEAQFQLILANIVART